MNGGDDFGSLADVEALAELGAASGAVVEDDERVGGTDVEDGGATGPVSKRGGRGTVADAGGGAVAGAGELFFQFGDGVPIGGDGFGRGVGRAGIIEVGAEGGDLVGKRLRVLFVKREERFRGRKIVIEDDRAKFGGGKFFVGCGEGGANGGEARVERGDLGFEGAGLLVGDGEVGLEAGGAVLGRK